MKGAVICVFEGLTLGGYPGSSTTDLVKSKSPLTVPDPVQRGAGFKLGKTY